MESRSQQNQVAAAAIARRTRGKCCSQRRSFRMQHRSLSLQRQPFASPKRSRSTRRGQQTTDPLQPNHISTKMRRIPMSNTAIKSPAELVAAVPAVLGFHPVDSLTALWADPDGRVVWTLRHGLAPLWNRFRTASWTSQGEPHRGDCAWSSTPRRPRSGSSRCSPPWNLWRCSTPSW